MFTLRAYQRSRLVFHAAPLLRNFSTKSKVPLALVKELRGASGAPINECKQALEAENGDIEKAFEWLRKKGMAAASKKASRSANEGLVGVKIEGNKAAIVEVNSETDFVARNDMFQSFVIDASATAFAQSGDGTAVSVLNVDTLLGAQIPGKNKSLGESLMDVASAIREKIDIRRASVVSVSSGVVAGYVHGSIGPNMGSSAALIPVEVGQMDASKKEALATMGRRLAMHAVAARPRYFSPADIPAPALEAERSLHEEQAKGSSKPAHIVEKMVAGRLNKFYSEVCLTHQPHMVEDDSPPVHKFLATFSKGYGSEVQVPNFVRYQTGEELY